MYSEIGMKNSKEYNRENEIRALYARGVSCYIK